MATVLPFYIVIDTSRSMRGQRIDSVNKALPRLHSTIGGDPVIAEKCLLSVISFATDAKNDLPLTDLSTVIQMPSLTAGGQTKYSVGLEFARQQIKDDVWALKAHEHTVLRPCLFFITDGRPGDSWKRIRDGFVDRESNPQAPNIVSYGVAGADVATLTRLSTRFTLTTDAGTDAATALKEVFNSIANSVVQTHAAGSGKLVIQPSGQGMTMIDNERPR